MQGTGQPTTCIIPKDDQKEEQAVIQEKEIQKLQQIIPPITESISEKIRFLSKNIQKEMRNAYWNHI